MITGKNSRGRLYFLRDVEKELSLWMGNGTPLTDEEIRTAKRIGKLLWHAVEESSGGIKKNNLSVFCTLLVF